MSNLGCSARRRASFWTAVVLIAIGGFGCSDESDSDSGDDSDRSLVGPGNGQPSGSFDNSASDRDTSAPFPSSGAGSAGAGAASPPFGTPGMTPPDGDSAGGVDVGSGGEADAGTVDPIDIEPGQLTAGEWSDLEDWSFWRGLYPGDPCEDTTNCADTGVAARMSEHWGYDTSGRVAVRVRSGSDAVVDAVVELRDEQQAIFTARTDSAGRAELFAGLFAESSGDYSVRVQAGGEVTEVTDLELGNAEPVEIEFPVAHAPPPSLDLMFMVDTTGSMGDELSYIQAELGHVIEQVRDEIGSQLTVRLSVNFYRDRGDEYLVRDFPFTTDIDQALEQLAAQSAAGGGDTPEAVEEALANAVDNHDWSEAATARLMFFVLDAPPHYDEGRLAALHAGTRAAAEKGVRIIPLAASGIDESTEFLLRMLAIATGGTYTFLTDHSGIGNSHLEPTIGPYDVELLDDLLVRVIRERL